MPSFGKCAALAAGLVGAVMASPHGHLARSIHQKKDFGSDIAGTVGKFFREGVLHGLNTESGPIAMNNAEGAYVVEFINNSPDSDVDLVLWSAANQYGTFNALTINVTPANITTKIPAGGNMTVSFNPSEFTEENGYPGAAGSLSGAWCPMYNNTPVSKFGGCDNTWGEFTFQHNDLYSTIDVSRLVNMNGVNMTIQTFPSKGADQACLSDMETCVYKCADGAATCPAGTCSACNGSTGCMGMPGSGYAVVYLG